MKVAIEFDLPHDDYDYKCFLYSKDMYLALQDIREILKNNDEADGRYTKEDILALVEIDLNESMYSKVEE